MNEKEKYFRQYGKWGNEDFKLPWDEVSRSGRLIGTGQDKIMYGVRRRQRQ